MVPARGQQVGAGGGLEGTPDHETEVAGSVGGDQGRLSGVHQPVDDGVGLLARLGQGTPEGGSRRLEVEGRTDPGVGGLRPIRVDPPGGADEQAVGHVPHVTTGVGR